MPDRRRTTSTRLKQRARDLAARDGISYQQALQAVRGDTPGRRRHFPLGLPPLDERRGARRGRLALIRAKNGAGATFMLTRAAAACAAEGARTLLVSLELAKDTMALRLPPSSAVEIRSAADDPAVQYPMTTSALRELLASDGYDAVFVDSLTLMAASDRESLSSYAVEARVIVEELAELADAADVLIVAAASVGRAVPAGLPLEPGAIDGVDYHIDLWRPEHAPGVSEQERRDLAGVIRARCAGSDGKSLGVVDLQVIDGNLVVDEDRARTGTSAAAAAELVFRSQPDGSAVVLKNRFGPEHQVPEPELRQLISQAGGVIEIAEANRMVVLRDGAGHIRAAAEAGGVADELFPSMAYETGGKGLLELQAGGMTVEVQPSSAASEHCWLRLKGRVMLTGSWREVSGVDHGVADAVGAVDLSVQDVVAVRDALAFWLRVDGKGGSLGADEPRGEAQPVRGSGTVLTLPTTYGDLVAVGDVDGVCRLAISGDARLSRPPAGASSEGGLFAHLSPPQVWLAYRAMNTWLARHHGS